MRVIIAGGGMTGVTLALALHRMTKGALPISLIEACPPLQHRSPAPHPGFDARMIALAHGTCQQLQRLSIWPLFAPYAAPIHSVHVSDQGHAGSMLLTAEEYQLEFLGQVVELQSVGNLLFQHLVELPGLDLHAPAKVVEVNRTQKSVSVLLDNGKNIQGSLLIAADGSSSSVARACHFSWQRKNYHHVAIITNIESEQPHHGRAFERFTMQGPLALLPMGHISMQSGSTRPDSIQRGQISIANDRVNSFNSNSINNNSIHRNKFSHYSTLVWCHPLSQQQQVAAWSDAEFCQRVQNEFGWRLGCITRCAQRNFYPLVLQVAEQHVSHRVALVGNVAQTLHPIAGQGFNLALRDAITLAEVVVQAWQKGEDPGSYTVLGDYQQRRRPDQQATVAMTNGLIHLFANHYQPLTAARNIGLTALDSVPLLRDPLIYRTLGWVKR